MSFLEKSEVLKYAAGVIERGFTQGVLARSEDGGPVPPISERAVSWCTSGAIERAIYELSEGRIQPSTEDCKLIAGNVFEDIRQHMEEQTGEEWPPPSIIAWNDFSGQTADVVAGTLRAAAE